MLSTPPLVVPSLACVAEASCAVREGAVTAKRAEAWQMTTPESLPVLTAVPYNGCGEMHGATTEVENGIELVMTSTSILETVQTVQIVCTA